MRKSPTIAPRVCRACGASYVPVGNRQFYCSICSSAKEKQRKREYYERKNPEAGSRRKSEETCCICGGVFSAHFDGKPYCNKHYQRMIRNGTTELQGRQRTNSYSVNGEILTVTLSNGRTFIADSADLEMIQRYNWCFNKSGYLVANIRGKITRLHRYLLCPDPGAVVDHINGDPSDNRRINLRICSVADNTRNSAPSKNSRTGVIGVKRVPNGKYVAQIMVNRKQIILGTFETLTEAAEARREAEKLYFGEFSPSTSRTDTSTPGMSE